MVVYCQKDRLTPLKIRLSDKNEYRFNIVQRPVKSGVRFQPFNNNGLFDAKAILVEQWWHYLTHKCWWIKVLYTFPQGIGPKVNVIAPLDFQLTYYDVTVLHVSHCATGTPQSIWVKFFKNRKYFLHLISFHENPLHSYSEDNAMGSSNSWYWSSLCVPNWSGLDLNFPLLHYTFCFSGHNIGSHDLAFLS